jgi:mono/diheme cytochrome c family protein
MAAGVQSDGLGRWLVGGLVVGAAVLGLMVAAYAIGYNRGQDKAPSAAPAATETTTATTETTTATTETTTASTTTGTAAVALGGKLFVSDGCSGCHSLDGAPGAGPTMKGLAGSEVTLSDGTTVTADDAYLAKAITDPDSQIVEGYQKGIMSGAIASFGLATKPSDVAAIVAYIKNRR